MSPVVRSSEVPPPRPLPPRPFPEVPVVPPPVPPSPPVPHHLAIPQVPVPETTAWEYKHVTRGSRAASLDEKELNALGREGWELVGVVSVGRTTHFYFKRETR
jgi:Domain of unknown function (DUF4177)